MKKIICGILVLMTALSLNAQQQQQAQQGQTTQQRQTQQQAQQQQSQQEQSEQRERTIEELYLSQNIELQILRNYASSDNWQDRDMAIQTLRTMASSGRINDDNPAAFQILSEMAKPIEQGRNQRNFNLIRRDACNILGELGGKRSQQILIEVLSLDKEPMVLSEAVYALGKIGTDPDGMVLTRMMHLLHNENVKPAPDNNFAYATLLSISMLAKGADGIKAADQIGPLIELLSCNYKKEVILKAKDVIIELLS